MPVPLTITAASLVVVAAVVLIVRRAEIRLVLLGAGLAMAALAGRPMAVADAFARAMVAPMVGPICVAIGFAAVLKATGCDVHLVHLLTAPLRRSRRLALPGGIAAAYLANLAIPSQSGTATMLGPVLIPLLASAGFGRPVAGAALVLGASFGGDLLSPAAQDVQALAGTTGIPAASLSSRVIPASLAGLVAAAAVFTLSNRPRQDSGELASQPGPERDRDGPPVRVDPIKAMIPLLPITLLLLSHAGWPPLDWLGRVPEADSRSDLAASLPVVRALLIGVAAAAATAWREPGRIGRTLFEGMGAAYRDVISLTIVARCFGAGIAACGLGDALLSRLGGSSWALSCLAVGFPWGLALLSGSGSGPVLAFAQACLAPIGDRPGAATLGALTCLSAAFGRTMSPVSAVVVSSSGLADVPPLELVRTLLPPLLCGAAVALATAALRG